MKLVTYRLGADGAGRLGVLHPTDAGEVIVDAEALGQIVGESFPDTMLGLIDMGPDALAALARAVEDTDSERPAGVSVWAENARLLAPIPRPRKNVFGIGLNYTEHVAESARTLDTRERPAAAAGRLLQAAHRRDRPRATPSATTATSRSSSTGRWSSA